MGRSLLVSLRMAVVTIVLTGLVYPLVVWGFGAVLFPKQAAGSLVASDGRIVGSALIGQDFTADKYFHPRPSAAGSGYDAMSSSASNLGPTSKTLIDSVKARVATATLENPGLTPGDVPVDMVTASASGLDPEISPDNAAFQVARVARARGISVGTVKQLVAQHTTGRDLWFLGEPRVNVLELNLALDALK